MNLATFDKLAYIDSLKANGVSEDQARAHAAALDTALHDVVATKADIAEVKADMTEVKADLKWIKLIGGAILAFLILPWLAKLVSSTMPGP